jgi:hypothetical protein
VRALRKGINYPLKRTTGGHIKPTWICIRRLRKFHERIIRIFTPKPLGNREEVHPCFAIQASQLARVISSSNAKRSRLDPGKRLTSLLDLALQIEFDSLL